MLDCAEFLVTEVWEFDVYLDGYFVGTGTIEHGCRLTRQSRRPEHGRLESAPQR